MASAEYQRAWRQRNPDKWARYQRKYKNANREELRARARVQYRENDGKAKQLRWAKANPEKIRAAKLKYRQKPATRAKERESDRLWRANNPGRLLLMTARIRARKCGISFTIPDVSIEIPDLCPVLGIPLMRGCGKLLPNSPTLDRINNSRGYEPGNVMVISYKANTMKNSASFEELKRFANFYASFLASVAA